MDDSSTILRAINLGSRTKCKSDTAVSKERSRSATVAAQIEVDVGAILVSTGKAVLRTQWVALSRAEVVDHDHNGSASIGQLVAR